MENQTPKKSIFILVSGMIFSGLGSYIVYRHFFEDETVSTMRLVLAIAMVGYGAYRLYNYFSAE
ncbi:hypothetical protein [Lacinutrix sp.]|jgi:uncharacterized membrane protein YobD (UPF0266 family)|uniref:hypothetical protein n=1 Tax=Lacinutrix sp. TaxID=1937692 RepID=UPI002621E6A3|nr:hypothetical protein [Lacinutrix sp.]MDG1715215.1 hypothetical protein [Lacinutrix sp.]